MRMRIFEDTLHRYTVTPNGVLTTPHSGSWGGYYRLGRGYGYWEMILVGIGFGTPPGVITVPIRTYEDLEVV